MEYRTINGKKTVYHIYEDGTVVNSKNGYVRKWYDNGNGYKCTHIKGKIKYIHRLVCALFNGDPPSEDSQVNHIDGDKENNHWSNLEWVSGSKNISHAHKQGQMKNRSNYGPIRRVPDHEAVEMYRRVKMGYGITATAKEYGISRTTLSSIVNKNSKSHLTDPIDDEFG